MRKLRLRGVIATEGQVAFNSSDSGTIDLHAFSKIRSKQKQTYMKSEAPTDFS